MASVSTSRFARSLSSGTPLAVPRRVTKPLLTEYPDQSQSPAEASEAVTVPFGPSRVVPAGAPVCALMRMTVPSL
jgi:hypothetical protein